MKFFFSGGWLVGEFVLFVSGQSRELQWQVPFCGQMSHDPHPTFPCSPCSLAWLKTWQLDVRRGTWA